MSQKEDSPSWTMSKLKVNAELAREILSNNAINRPIVSKTVQRYLKDMEDGLWYEPTVIYRDDQLKLIDGQHRLSALSQAANLWLWFVVIDHVNPKIIDAIDGGVRRTDAQRLIMHGKQKQISTLLASMLGHVINLKRNRKLTSGNVSFPEKVSYLEGHPEIEDYADHWSVNGHVDSIQIKHALIATFHYVTSRIDKEKADEFFDLLTVSDLDEDSPVKAFQEFAASKIKSRNLTPAKIERDSAIALLVAWEFFRQGKPLRKMTPGAEVPHVEFD